MAGTQEPKKPKKRSYYVHSQDVIEKALEAMRTKTVSSYEAEKIFGIPRRTLLDKLHNKHPKRPGCPTRLTDEEEANMIKVLIAAADYGSPLTLLDLRIVIYRYLDANGKLHIFNNKLPGRKWAYTFLKRNKSKLSYRVIQNINRNRGKITPHDFIEYFRNLKVSLEGIPNENILNYDETNLADNPGTQKCLFKRGVKYPERIINFTKGAISIMFAITAAGECLPPYVVYKAEHLYTQWTINGPKGSRFNRSKSGWFDNRIFEDWFENIILPWAQTKSGSKILIGDNLASHINLKIVQRCEQNDIRFVFLPPNSSHLTQPLDVCYFGPMKKLWREILLNYKIKNPRETTINKGHFPDLLKKLTEKLNDKTHNIISAFNSTGIAPFNPDRVICKLPDFIQPSITYTVDNALLDFLKETRSADANKKIRSKKLKVLPGKSVSSDDFAVFQPLKKGLKTNKREIDFTIQPVDSSSPLMSSLTAKTPESLSTLCTTVLNAQFIQTVQNSDATWSPNSNVHGFSRILKNDETNISFYGEIPECLQTTKPKVIITSDVIIHAASSQTVKQENAKIKKKDKQISQSALNMKLVARKNKNETSKTKKSIKRRKNRYSSESSVSSTNSKIQICMDDSECETMEDYLIAYLQEEKENIELTTPFGFSDIEYFTEENDKLTTDSWILAKFATKKSLKHFVGKVISFKDNIPEVKFVRKVKESKSNKGIVFTYPTVDDICTMNTDDVIMILPKPNISRRGQIIFNIDLSTYNVQ